MNPALIALRRLIAAAMAGEADPDELVELERLRQVFQAAEGAERRSDRLVRGRSGPLNAFEEGFYGVSTHSGFDC